MVDEFQSEIDLTPALQAESTEEAVTAEEVVTSNDVRRRLVMILVVALVVIVGAVIFWLVLRSQVGRTENTDQASTVIPGDTLVVGVSLGSVRNDRWQRDLEMIEASLKTMNSAVNVQIANEDANVQITQAENLISQGVDALIVIPHDSSAAAEIVDLAHEEGIGVIAYDRMIKSDKLDYYVSFDSVKVGEFQAQGVLNVVDEGNFAYIGGSEQDNNAFLLKEGSYALLQPLIDAGQIRMVLESFTPGWRHEEAYRTVNNFLNSGGSLDAVVAANDGTAFGVIQALEEHGLAGKVPVSGQDAELTAMRRLVEGTQTVSVYKPIRLLAAKAAEMAVAMAKNELVETNSEVSNGKVDVPSYLIESVPVTVDTIEETVVRDGFHSYEEVFGVD